MKSYKQIEYGIEYEVFDFERGDLSQVEHLGKKEHAKIIRNGHTYYFRYGEAHNDYGPALIREFDGRYEEDYYQFGRRLNEEEFKNIKRTELIDRMLKEKNIKI